MERSNEEWKEEDASETGIGREDEEDLLAVQAYADDQVLIIPGITAHKNGNLRGRGRK